jgi:thiol:disulfide interchange protein DsbD
LDTDGKDLSKPIAFTFDKQEYKKWLEDGIAAYKK